MTTEVLNSKLVNQCKVRLIEAKEEVINRIENAREQLNDNDKGGDEADITQRSLAESEVAGLQMRLQGQLIEIDMALGRIENGTYGICDETEEPIEADRLMAIPWTQLSIEGAEFREGMRRKFAR